MSKAFVLRPNAFNLRSICLKNTNGCSITAIQLFDVHRKQERRKEREYKYVAHLRSADIKMPPHNHAFGWKVPNTRTHTTDTM